MPSPVHALAALGLLLTSMYTGVLKTHQPSDAIGQSQTDHESRDPEKLVMAMERVSILFDRWDVIKTCGSWKLCEKILCTRPSGEYKFSDQFNSVMKWSCPLKNPGKWFKDGCQSDYHHRMQLNGSVSYKSLSSWVQGELVSQAINRSSKKASPYEILGQ